VTVNQTFSLQQQQRPFLRHHDARRDC